MSPKLEQPLRVWHLIVGLGLTLFGAVFSFGMAWASLNAEVTDLKEKAARVEGVREDIREIRTDVAWIKERLK